MNKIFIFCSLCALCFTRSYSQISFREDSTYVLESYQIIAVQDVNNDTLDDVVLGTLHWNMSGIFPDSVEQVIEVYHQTDSNTFVLSQRFKYDTITSYAQLTSIEIADMNNDGLKDITISYGNKVAIYSQDASFHFHPAYQFWDPLGLIKQIEVAKLFHDSLESIIISYPLNYLIILRPTSIFTYDTIELHSPSISSLLSEFTLGDFNSDHLMDIAAVSSFSLTNTPAYIFYQDSANGFSNNGIPLDTIFPFSNCNGIGAGDLNNDKLTDIVATFGGNANPYIGIFYQDTTNHTVRYVLDTISHVLDIPSEVQVRDLNNDGLNDLIVLHDGWATLSVYEQKRNGGGIVHDASYFDFHGTTHIDSYAFIDLNHDNKIDIISVGAGEIKYYYNTSPSILQNPTVISLSFSIFPNPLRDNLFIRANTDLLNSSEKINSITIQNILGQKFDLNSIQINKFEFEINTQSLSDGLYFLIIDTDKQHIVNRFVKCK